MYKLQFLQCQNILLVYPEIWACVCNKVVCIKLSIVDGKNNNHLKKKLKAKFFSLTE